MAELFEKDVDVHERILNEYKEGKAYQLYESLWLKEILIPNPNPSYNYCFLTAINGHI